MTRHIEIHIKAMELARKREREKYRNNNNYYLKSNKKQKKPTNKQKKKDRKSRKRKTQKEFVSYFKEREGKKIYNNKTCSLFIHEEK